MTSELVFTISLVKLLQQYESLNQLKCLWFHIPNEGYSKLSPSQARLRKLCGTTPGAPDFVFMANNQVVCIELKTDKGRLSSNQKLFKDKCFSFNVPYYVARDSSQVLDILKEYDFI